MEKKKIVIIGAGPAGVTAAYELLRNNKDYEVVIYEAENMLGGISKTVSFDGNLVDTGIHRFFSKDDRVMNLWTELLPIQAKNSYDDILLNNKKDLPKKGPDPEEDEEVMLVRDRITRIYYGKKFFDYPVSLSFTTIKNLGFFKIILAGFSYIKACIFKKKEDSLENFYINRFGKVLYGMFFRDYTEKVWGRKASDISADWGSQRVKGISITAVIKDMFNKVFGKKNKDNTETSLIESFYYPKMGAGQIWNVMAQKIEELGGSIVRNTLVKNINIEEGKIGSVTIVKDEKEEIVKADYVISSMPLVDLINGISGVEVPTEVLEVSNGLPYRNFMSVGLLAKKLNLKNETNVKTLNNVIPDSWIYVQEPEVKMGRLQVFNNWSPYLFKNKEDIKDKVLLTLEYFCDYNDEYWNMPDDEFINFAVEEAIKINLIDSKDDVISSNRMKIHKAYPAYFDTYDKIDKVIEYLNGFENLYCIGRNGQHRYNNMDHSMITGMETANNILNDKKDKSNIWNVNTEKDYHEAKK